MIPLTIRRFSRKMLKRLKHSLAYEGQMSESLVLSLILSFSGGFQDAYTYAVRGNVFANAQTGNIVLMSAGFMSGEWRSGLRYLLPVLAFAAGVLLAESIRRYFNGARFLHWRQSVLIFEILTMLSVGFFPKSFDIAANILVSLSCAMQVQAFRRVCGNSYASTMCIGNLRSGTERFSSYIRTRDKSELKSAFCYFAVILFFAAGAGAGVCLSDIFGIRTVWFCCILLALCFLLMLEYNSDRKKDV